MTKAMSAINARLSSEIYRERSAANEPTVGAASADAAAERLRTKLLESRRRLLPSTRRSLPERPYVDRDDLPDDMDAAASAHAQFVLFRNQERDASLLRRIESALRRIANGAFGTCDRCGQDIPPERLDALPVTTLCVDCEEEQDLEMRRFSAVHDDP
jgi:RNA polymerase-binding transcription factor